jgi:hypothetical protein
VEGHKRTGVLVVLVNNGDPSQEAEFNKWYNEVHIPDVVGTGSYYHATRYENTNPKPGEARYLAIYETDWEDPEQAFNAMSEHVSKMVIWPKLEVVHVATYKYIGKDAPAAQATAAATV